MIDAVYMGPPPEQKQNLPTPLLAFVADGKCDLCGAALIYHKATFAARKEAYPDLKLVCQNCAVDRLGAIDIIVQEAPPTAAGN